jgi:hypothetical protein
MTATPPREMVAVQFAISPRGSVLGVIAVVVLSASACGDQRGQFELALVWPAGALDETPLYVTARVEDASKTPAQTLASAPPVRVEAGGAVELALADVPNGTDRKVVVEVRRTQEVVGQVVLYGTSAPFDLQPGLHVRSEVAVALRAPPHPVDGVVPLQIESEVGRNVSRTATVTLALAVSGGEILELTSDADFPGAATTEVALGAAEELVPGVRRWRVPWTLPGLTSCIEPAGCLVPIYARVKDEVGYASVSLQVDVRWDPNPPQLSESTEIQPRVATADRRITVELRLEEPLVRSPRVFVPDVPLDFERLLPVEDGPSGTYTLRSLEPAGALGPDGTYALFADLQDEAGNRARARLGEVTVDRTRPEVLSATVTPSRSGVGEVAINFEVSRPLSGVPEILVGETSVADVTMEGLRITARHEVRATAPQGRNVVSAVVVDLAGNSARAALGTLFVDTEAPALLAAEISPPVVGVGEGALLALTLDEAPGWRGPEPDLDLILAPGVPSNPFRYLTSVGLTHVFEAPAAALEDGVYSLVEVRAVDPLGNARTTSTSASLVADLQPPTATLQVTPEALDPARTPTLVVTATLSEPIDPARALFALDGAALTGCAPSASHRTYTCTHALSGAEVAPGAQREALITLDLRDDAGNLGGAAASVRFDRAAPQIARLDIAYAAAPNGALSQVARAGRDGGFTVTVIPTEPLSTAPADPPLVTLDTLTAQVTGWTALQVSFEGSVGTTPDGLYGGTIVLTDRVGNRSPPLPLPEPISVKTSPPILAVDQAALMFLRVPVGASTPVTSGGFTRPAGPYFALAPTATPELAALPAATFTSPDPLPVVRVWADGGRVTLMGSLQPLGAGGWPRTALSPLDVPQVWVTGVDDAGNESVPVRVQTSELVVQPSSARSFARLAAVDDEFPLATTRTDLTDDPGHAGPDLDATLFDAPLLEAAPGMSGTTQPEGRAYHAVTYDAARGEVLLFGGCGVEGGDSSEFRCRPDLWAWHGGWERRARPHQPAMRGWHGLAYDHRRGVTVLFGGEQLTGLQAVGVFADTWEWDGDQWSERNADPGAPRPPAGRVDRMAWEPARSEVVVHAGGAAYGWDGDIWTDLGPVVPVTNPCASFVAEAVDHRDLVSMGYLFTGGSSGIPPDQICSFDGTTETRTDIAGPRLSNGVSGRKGVFDTVGDLFLMLGGRVSSTVSVNPWFEHQWDGTTLQTGLARPVEPIIPQVQLELDLAQAGFEPERIVRLEARVIAGASGPAAVMPPGFDLLGWKSSGGGGVSRWLPLASSATPASAAPPYLPSGAEVVWSTSDPAQLRSLVFADRTVFVRLAPRSITRPAAGAVRYALDHLEARVRYTAP